MKILQQTQSTFQTILATDMTALMVAELAVLCATSVMQFLETPQFESIWLALRRPVMPRQVSHIAIGSIYQPPGTPSGAMVHQIISAVDAIISQHPHAGFIIVGDFNTLDDRSIRS